MKRHTTRVSLALLPIVSALAFAGCGHDDADLADGGDGIDSVDGGDAGEPVDEDEANGLRITGVAVGHGGLSYQGVEGGEQGSRGPAAYLVDERGLNWIADGPGNQVLVVNDEGAIVERYNLDGLVRRIEDIEVTATHLYVLESGLARPTVARVGRGDVAATAWESFPLPADVGDRAEVTGLRKDADGAVQLELSLGLRVRALFSADGGFLGEGQAVVTSKHRVGDRLVELLGFDASDPEADRSAGALVIDGVEVHSFRAAGLLAGLGFLAAGRDGEFWVRVQDVGLVAGAIDVRDLAYRFGPAGEVLEVVELPMTGQAVYVHHRVAFDLDGKVRALRTTLDEVVLVEPPLYTADPVAGRTPTPRPTLGGAAPTPQGQTHAPALADPIDPQAAPCVTGQQIMDRAWSYVFYAATYTSANLDKTCTGRTRPDSLQVGALTTGVVYSYAGYETLETYANAVAQGKVVGDIQKAGGVAQCAHGVDCSGFVSRAWAAPHNTTRSIPNISTPIEDLAQLIPGDALNSYDHHVRLVAEFRGNSVFVVESTTGGFDRVIGRELSWGENQGYTPVRYHNHCGYFNDPNAPQPPPPAPQPDPEPQPDPNPNPEPNPQPQPNPQDTTPKDWHFRNSHTSGPADFSLLPYGYRSDLAVVGDWNGDGIDTPAVFRDGTWYIKNDFEGAIGEIEVAYGSPGDIPVVGDWNGDGIDTIGVYRDTTFFLRNSNSPGDADMIFQYGVPGNRPVVGDWDGDGVDTIGVYIDNDGDDVTGGHWMLRNSNTPGWADIDFGYGSPGFLPVVGDWDNNGTDTVGVLDLASQTWMLSNVNAAGWFQISFQYGDFGDLPLIGDWNGDGIDTAAIVR